MKTFALFGFVLGVVSAAGQVILTQPGETVILSCAATEFQRNLEWRDKSELIFRETTSGFRHKGSSDIVRRSRLRVTDLQIQNVKGEDAGKFTCTADGKTQEMTLLVVSVRASPSGDLQLGSEATLQCQVKGLTPEPAVRWTKPDGTSHTGSQEVQLNSVARSDAGKWTCNFLHDGTTHSQSIDIKVTEPVTTKPATVSSQTSKNAQKPSCKNCGDADPPSDSGLLLGLAWWMWVVVGLGCLVVVLLVIFVICMCKRIKRKKRKLYKMKNGRQPLTPKQYCQCNRPTAAAKPQQGRRREKPSAPPLQPLLME